MKISIKWLQEIVDISVESPDLAERLTFLVESPDLAEHLTFLGLEVEHIGIAAPPFHGIVIGEILNVIQHPNAQRLNICQVRVSDDETTPLIIVCGADNVRPTLKVAVAKVGALLPNEQAIKAVKLQGQDSFGMICSASELGLDIDKDEKSKGILELPDDAPVGKDLRKYLDLDDSIIELSLTPNRGDCLSMLGIAREIVAYYNYKKQMNSPPLVIKNIDLDTLLPPTQLPEQGCLYYATRTIRNINARAKLPILMQERLRRCGIRPVSCLVDILHYVMLEVGQPFHVFDLAKLSLPLEVRYAALDEKVTLLNGTTIKLTKDDLVIADKNRVQALAGVMGAMDSAVTEATQDIVLESAVFDPIVIARQVQRYQLHSEASHRFERGVDPQLPLRALELLTSKLLPIVGGNAHPVHETTFDYTQIKKTTPIFLRYAQIKRLLGIKILNKEKVKRLLLCLGFQLKEVTKQKQEGWDVIPPSYRLDITCEANCIGEIIRLCGYENIPSNPVHSTINPGVFIEKRYTYYDTGAKLLVNRGYREIVSYSFVAPEAQKCCNPSGNPSVRPLPLSNPISHDKSVMRTSLWPSLLENIKYNQDRQQVDLKIFEKARCYYADMDKHIKQEEECLAGAISGERQGASRRQVDFFDIKGDVESLLNCLCVNDAQFIKKEHPCLHPGQSACISQGEDELGYVGQLHPNIKQELGLNGSVFLFELYFDKLRSAARDKSSSDIRQFSPFSKFPQIHRDICLEIPESLPSAEIQEYVKQCLGDSGLLQSVTLFDLYKGDSIKQDDCKSITLRLVFQHMERTLTNQEVDHAIASLLIKLKIKHDVELRKM